MSLLSNSIAIVGSVMALSALPQIIKIFRRKSAKDISVATYILLLLGGLVWIAYGIEIGNFPIVITNSIGILMVALIIWGWFLYGRQI